MSGPDWIAGDPAELRRWRERQPEVLRPILPPEVRIETVAPEGQCLGGLLFTPPDARGTDILHFHGGGFVVGSPETHRVVSAWVAQIAQARVLSVRYRLAPEYSLPAQGNDAAAAIRRRLLRSTRLRLVGDSAGALVALWGFAALTADEREQIQGCLLIYGAFGRPNIPVSENAELEALGLGPHAIAAMWARVDPESRMPGDPMLDPLTPGFPLPRRLIILAAGEDPVLADSRALAARSGAELVVAQGQVHGFLSDLPAPAALEPLTEVLVALSS